MLSLFTAWISCFTKNQVSVDMSVYIWIFNLILLINISVFIAIQCCSCYSSFIIQLEVGNGDNTTLILFFRMILAILGFLCFHMKLRMSSQPLWITVLEFWWIFHCICRFLSVGWLYVFNVEKEDTEYNQKGSKL